MRTVFKYRFEEYGAKHMRVSLFVGPDFDHFALSGELVFRLEEWDAFKGSLKDSSCVIFEKKESADGN